MAQSSESPTLLQEAWPIYLLADLSDKCLELLIEGLKIVIANDLSRYQDAYFGKSENENDNVNYEKSMIEVEALYPSKPFLREIAQQGVHRDSQANIYALAVLAHRNGYSRIIVVDRKTRFQLQTSLEGNNEQDVTVVTAFVGENPWAGYNRDDRMFVCCRRTFCFHTEEEQPVNRMTDDYDVQSSRKFLFDPQRSDDFMFRPEIGPLWMWEFSEVDPYYHGTRILHDPDRAPLTTSPVPLLGHELYRDAVDTALRPFLPIELRDEVLSLVSKHKVNMPIWERNPDASHLVIFVLFETTATQLEIMQSEIEENIPSAFRIHELMRDPFRDVDFLQYEGPPSMTVELIPWEKHRISNRRDLFKVWDEHRLWDGPWKYLRTTVIFPLLYLMEPFSGMESTHFGVLGQNTNWTMTVPSTVPTVINCRLKLGDLCRAFHRTRNIAMEGFDHFDFSDPLWGWFDVEELSHPDEPFYPIGPGQAPGTNSSSASSVFVFLISNQLNDDEMIRLNSEMRCYPLVRRESNEPGDVESPTVNDIWNIVYKVAKHQAVSRDEDFTLICVDKQYKEDSTVIIARSNRLFANPDHDLLRHLPLSGLQGIKIARIAIHRMWSALRRLELDDETWSTYRRPGWPGPEELPQAYVGDEDFVDGDSLPLLREP